MNRLLFRLMTVAAAAVLGASSARADLVLTFEGLGPKQDAEMKGPSYFYDPNPIGLHTFSVDPASTTPGFGPTIQAFCAEIDTNVLHTGSASYNVVAPAALTDVLASGDADNKVRYLTEMFGRYYDQRTTNDGAAAFQYAVYEILYDPVTNLDINSGNARLFGVKDQPDSQVPGLAAGWLASLSGDTTPFTTKYAGYELVGFQSDASQDQIGLKPVPAPPALLLGGLGVFALGLRARRGRAVA